MERVARRSPDVTPKLFDRAVFAARQKSAAAKGENVLLQIVAEELTGRLALIKRTFAAPCVIGPDPEYFIRRLNFATATAIEVQANDTLPFERTRHDAIFSLLDLHAVNDVPGYLAQIARALKPDGLFIACLFAGETLTELRQSWYAAETAALGGVTPRVAPMIDVRELGGLLQRAGLALPVADIDRHVVRHADPLSLMREVKSLGLSNCLSERSRKPVTRGLLLNAAQHFAERFSDGDRRTRAIIELAWATAWSPHKSQQKPLKPGSARMRLSDILKP
ncbi:MAG: methyltransferase domain-containing protein [Rhizobiales bacterium]|nr:methyltransferase domain-containing protein [Hyphomicrobiales bacterium]